MRERPSPGLDWLHDDVGGLRERYERLNRRADGGRWSWETLEHGGHRVRVLVQEPGRLRDPDRVIVYFHGGGWIVGSPETHADISRALCEATGLKVLSVDYRLAPEHPAPAPIDDGHAVVMAMATKSIVLCGDSAGASIALAVERRAGPGILGVCAFYGCFGLLESESLRLRGSREAGTDRACVARMWRLARASGVYSMDALSACSPVPVYLLAGSQNPLLDDTLAMAAAFGAAGRDHVLDVVQGETHGFLHDAGPRSLAALERVAAWIAER